LFGDRRGFILTPLSILCVGLALACAAERTPIEEPGFGGWSQSEIDTLASLWLENLPPLPPDSSNAVAEDPRAAELGQQIFFDSRFSANGGISCASCHQPDRLFTDGLPRGQAIGITDRHTPAIAGTAYEPWLFWDGRSDSLWAQALIPMESAVEHGGTRTLYAHIIAGDEEYRAAYEQIFGTLPDLSNHDRFPASAGPVEEPGLLAAWEAMDPADQDIINHIYANIGKSIAAYERLILPGSSRFDGYVEALLNQDKAVMDSLLTEDEVAGLKLFIGHGNCTQCHNGPLFTNNGFHSTGVPDPEGQPPDIGRFAGAQLAVADEFNCLGPYSDAAPGECEELRFIKLQSQELMGAFKVPGLRNVVYTAPYMHAGQFSTLDEVLNHYNQAPGNLGPTGHTDLLPLGFSQLDLDQLEAFLGTLSAPLDAPPGLLSPPPKNS